MRFSPAISISASRSYLVSDLLIVLISVFLFVYILVRAYLIPFTWDENYTFNAFVLKQDLFNEKFVPMSANNHLMNTWLMWLIYQVAGHNEFLFRLPNILASIVFMYFFLKIIEPIRSQPIKVTGFLLLNLNPFVLDFFSLARGYGISLSILMISLFYLKRFLESDNSSRDIFIALLILSIGFLVNLTLVYVYALLVIIGVLFFVMNKKKIQLAKNWPLIGASVFLTGYALYMLLQLKNANSLFYGGYTGLWHDTVNSLVFRSLYDKPYSENFHLIIKIVAAVILLMGFIFLMKDIIQRKQLTTPFLYGCILLFLGCLAMEVGANKIFGVPFLIDRTAIFLIPIFSLITIFLLDQKLKNGLMRNTVCLFICGGTLIHFLLCMNWNHVLLWK